MQRRNFLKLASAMAATRVVPVAFGMTALAQRAYAASPNLTYICTAARLNWRVT